MVDAWREPDGEITRAGTELEHAAWRRSQQAVDDRERLRWVGRPVAIRCRDLLVAELRGELGREMAWFAARRLGHTRSAAQRASASSSVSRTAGHSVRTME